jgi:hypothetical protein
LDDGRFERGNIVSAMTQGAIIGMCVAMLLLYFRKMRAAKAGESAAVAGGERSLAPTRWKGRSVAIKIGGCALITVLIVGFSVLVTRPPPGRMRDARTAAFIGGTMLFAAVAGALIGYCLALRDLVDERKGRGERVHLVLRAYFAWGIGSLILWFVTLFAAGIGGIIFYYAFLSPGVGRAG